MVWFLHDERSVTNDAVDFCPSSRGTYTRDIYNMRALDLFFYYETDEATYLTHVIEKRSNLE